MVYRECFRKNLMSMRIIRVFARLTVLLVQYILRFDIKLRKQFLIISSALVIIFAGVIFYSWIDFRSVKNLKSYSPPVPSRLLDRNGSLISTFFTDNRVMVNLKNMPPYLGQAFIAIEDNLFYSHHGIDIQSIIRAAFKNMFIGGLQGGSTITQQVAKVIFTNRSRTFTRKIKEACIALYLDYLYDKNQIMNLYFNEIYFGHGNYGVEAASLFYFNKPAAKVSVGEAAILASLPSAPNRYSPVRNPHLSHQRVIQVLLRMIDMNFITKQQALHELDNLDEYYSTLNISPDANAFGRRLDRAPYFTEYMRGVLEEKVGKKMLYEKGLTIYTSLDINHQLAAQKALWDGLKNQLEKGYDSIFTRQLEFSDNYTESIELIRNLTGLGELDHSRSYDQFKFQLEYYKYMAESLEVLNHVTGGQEGLDDLVENTRNLNPYIAHLTPPQGAIVEIDQQTGEVTAMVGGTPYSAVNQINRAVNMKRQPGSTFKPILYATAINMKKITAASIFPDMPLIQPDAEGEYWIPENSGGGYKGFVTIREALTNSINMVSIAIAREIGFRNSLGKIAEQLHVDKSEIPVNLTVVLGSFEVSPLQLARSFALFPRGGKDIKPYFLNEILHADGKSIYRHRKDNINKSILEPGTTTIITDILKDVVDKGTGKAIRKIGYEGFAAGKTGTSSNFRDAWFVGFNERYTSAVWIGYDKPSQSLGEGQFGGSIAAPIWGYFQYYTQPYRKKEDEFLVHEGIVEIEICKSTGKLATADCEETIKELFLPGTEPQEADTESAVESIQSESGLPDKNKSDSDNQKKLMEDIY